MARLILPPDIYSSLRQQIIDWQRRPGDSLPEEQLAREFQVSRTPLREALRKLAEDGLVELIPHRGARVAQLDESILREIFVLREALEGVAAREAAPRIEPMRLGELRGRFNRLRVAVDSGDLSEVGDEIHDEILSACGSDRLRHAMKVIMGQVLWTQRLAEQSSDRLLTSFREHEAILTALEARDPVGAEGSVRSHIRSVLRDLVLSTSQPLQREAGSRGHRAAASPRW